MSPEQFERAYNDPTVRLAATTAMTRGDEGCRARYPMHVDNQRPDVQLGYNPGPVDAYGALDPAPEVRLAHKPYAQGDNQLMGRRGGEVLPDELRPALLVSYVYMEKFLQHQHRYAYRDWVLDSGAFSAHQSKVVVDNEAYIDRALSLLETDPTLTEVFALDVIGDWKASLKNAERAWERGLRAIPTYHAGEPEAHLLDLAARFPKVALGGVAREKSKRKIAWAQQCFARVWPKALHGFGFGSEESVLALPWHSVDATNWELGPCKYGRWQSFGQMSVRGSKQNLRAEVEWYLNLERRARQKWAKEMREIGSVPSVRLSVQGINGARGGNE